MVLIDTSVWLKFLANQSPYAAGLSDLLDRDEVAAHELVYGELLIGDSGGRIRLLSNYRRFHHVPVVAHEEVVELVRAHRLHGRGAGWIDIHLLASALVARTKLWTADHSLFLLAQDLNIAYLPPPTRRSHH